MDHFLHLSDAAGALPCAVAMGEPLVDSYEQNMPDAFSATEGLQNDMTNVTEAGYADKIAAGIDRVQGDYSTLPPHIQAVFRELRKMCKSEGIDMELTFKTAGGTRFGTIPKRKFVSALLIAFQVCQPRPEGGGGGRWDGWRWRASLSSFPFAFYSRPPSRGTHARARSHARSPTIASPYPAAPPPSVLC